MKDTRAKIADIVAQLPDRELDSLLVYLEELMLVRQLDERAGNYLNDIMQEDDNLLKRLAQ
jgi:hypothetical protein